MMNLHIVRPLSKQDFAIAWLEVNTPTGNMIIQPNHAPMILILSPGTEFTFCLSNGKQESVTVLRGVAEVTRTHTTILLNE